MKPSGPLYGAIEAGGTKFVCAIGERDGELIEQIRLDTRYPATTLAEVCRYFEATIQRYGALAGVGVGAFGPLDLKPASATYGFITSTPKPGWVNTDLLGVLRLNLRLPVQIDTDVNGAALAELRWGAGQHLESLVYVTVGAGVVHHGRPVHGLMHPEVGHVRVQRHPADPNFGGICPYHGDCLEGLACGASILARTGSLLKDIPASAPIWAIEADYLGQLCALLVLTHSPERILLGGGVMQSPIHSEVQGRMLHWLNDYLDVDALRAPNYISAPGLGTSAGIKGALALAIDSARIESGNAVL
jgi:fructokinase